MEISEILKTGPALGLAVIGVAAALLKSIKALLEFHDEYLSKRRFKRQSFFAAEAEKSPELKSFVESLKHEAIFQATFGRPASPRKASAVMKLYQTGHFSHSELRESYLFMEVDANGDVKVHTGFIGSLLLWVISVFLVAVAVYLGTIIFLLIRMESARSLSMALGVLIFALSVFWYFGRDLRSVLLARKIHRKLSSLRTTEPSSKLQPLLHGEAGSDSQRIATVSERA